MRSIPVVTSGAETSASSAWSIAARLASTAASMRRSGTDEKW
jgi:hypothetical protein